MRADFLGISLLLLGLSISCATYNIPAYEPTQSLDAVQELVADGKLSAGYLALRRLHERGHVAQERFLSMRSVILERYIQHYVDVQKSAPQMAGEVERSIRYILENESLADTDLVAAMNSTGDSSENSVDSDDSTGLVENSTDSENSENSLLDSENSTETRADPDELPVLVEQLRILADYAYLEGIAAMPDDDFRLILPQEGRCYGEVFLQRIAEEAGRREITYNGVPPCSVEETTQATLTVIVDNGSIAERGVSYPNISTGSGFFISPEGYILTNYHVIRTEVDPKYEGYSRAYISIDSNLNSRVPAKVIAYDVDIDIALLKTEIEPPVSLMPYAEIKVERGQRILAYGAPVGLAQTVTSGIVSARRAEILPFTDVIQYDAFGSYGSSGSALLSESGDFVGMVFGGVETYEGLGLAIPAEMISAMLPRLFQTGGALEKPWFGLLLAYKDKRLVVSYVFPNSPAARAGIKPQMVLESINTIPITSITEAQRALYDQEFVEGLHRVVLSSELPNLAGGGSQSTAPGKEIDEASGETADGASNKDFDEVSDETPDGTSSSDSKGYTQEIQRRLLIAAEKRPRIDGALFMQDVVISYLGALLGLDLEIIELKQRLRRSRFLVRTVYDQFDSDFFNFRKGDELELFNWQATDTSLQLQIIHRKKSEGYFEKLFQLELPFHRVSML